LHVISEAYSVALLPLHGFEFAFQRTERVVARQLLAGAEVGGYRLQQIEVALIGGAWWSRAAPELIDRGGDRRNLLVD
jgi:hypothetical protein